MTRTRLKGTLSLRVPAMVVDPKPNEKGAYHKVKAAFPQLFDPAAPILLKIGIRDDIAQRTGLDAEVVGFVLRGWCQRAEYLKATVAGAKRFDCDGNPAGLVTEDDVRWAAARLEKKKGGK